MLDTARKEELLSLTKRLISLQSYSGHEKEVARELESYMRKHGFDDVTVDDDGNIVGRIRGNRPGKKILFDGHIDTVPVADLSGWSHEPFAGVVEDGRIYGRGTSDMKGAVAAYTAAAAFFLEDTKRDFAGEVCVDGVVHEECFEGVAARLISRNVKPDYVIIGEASDCNIKIGQRGRAEIVLETFGKPAHSSNPDKGVNAVYGMSRIIGAIRKLPCTEHPFLGKGILELTDIKSSPYPGASVVPSYCRATYDRRLLVGETRESVLEPIQKLLADIMKEDPSVHAKVSYAVGKETCYTGREISGERFFPGWLFDEKEEYIQKSVNALHSIGQEPEITKYSFCTNGSHYAGEAGIRTFGFGPSREDLAHTDDEYCELSQLTKACEGYEAIMWALTR